MHGFSEHQLLGAFLAVACLLFVTRAMAELSRRLGQPQVLGELLGGFLLGPSVLGALLPGSFRILFMNREVSLSLSLLSWMGAILLLMIAGMEADLDILRKKATPGLLAAAGAVGSSIAIGTVLGTRVFGQDVPSAVFLGLVLSVTAVSVVAKLLIEREALRRDYAQVLLAAGIAGEVVVWPLISVISSIQHRSNPFVAGIRSALLAAGFFVFMLTLGRRFTFWAMRRVADVTFIPNGELSLVLILLCVAASATAFLGLHPLLGAFVFGVLLSKAPRATIQLKERIQALTVALFAPIFFGLAGMRVNLFQLRGLNSLKGIAILLLLAGLVKVLAGFLGALAGRLPAWEAATVGVGLTLKGGTDVVVAIVGTELLLLSPDLYTTYAVVAILTVIVTPPIINRLAAKTSPGEAELRRLNREEARRLAYLADRERLLLPLIPELLPAVSADIVSAIARAKHAEGELFDITKFSLGGEAQGAADGEQQVAEAVDVLAHAGEQSYVELQQIRSTQADSFAALQVATEGQHLLAIAAREVIEDLTLSFGEMQDKLIRETNTDVLLTISAEESVPPLHRILVPLNGLGHSLAAADVAGYLAKGTEAEIVLFAVTTPRLGPSFWRERKHRDLLQAGYATMQEAQARISRLNIRVSERVVLAEDPAEAVIAELRRQPYDLLMLGGVVRASEKGIALGRTVERLLCGSSIPRVLLLSRTVDTSNA